MAEELSHHMTASNTGLLNSRKLRLTQESIPIGSPDLASTKWYFTPYMNVINLHFIVYKVLFLFNLCVLFLQLCKITK